jgi:hypothetical protein
MFRDITILYRPWGLQENKDPRSKENRHMKVVRLSAQRTGCLYPQEIFLVLISIRGCVNTPKATLRPEGLSEWNTPITKSEIEPATFSLVVQERPCWVFIIYQTMSTVKIEHSHLQFSAFTGQVQEIRYIAIEEISIMINCKWIWSRLMVSAA